MDSQRPSDQGAAERAAAMASSIERIQQLNRRAHAVAAETSAYRATRDRRETVPSPLVLEATIHIVLRDDHEPVIRCCPGLCELGTECAGTKE